jgi:hypothetical protein
MCHPSESKTLRTQREEADTIYSREEAGVAMEKGNCPDKNPSFTKKNHKEMHYGYDKNMSNITVRLCQSIRSTDYSWNGRCNA